MASRLLGAAALIAATLASAAASAQTITAPLGRAVRVPLGGSAADVVVGDPKIADVTVVSPTAIFVAGKAFGATNLVVLDRTGRTIFSGSVQVPMSSDGQVSVVRGGKASAYLCSPTCGQLSKDAQEDATTASAMAAMAPTPAVAAPAPAPAPASAAVLR